MKVGDIDAWQPPAAIGRYPSPVWWFGFLCLAFYSACLVAWPDVGSPAETLMALLGLIVLLAWGGALRRSAALWLLLAAIGVQLISWGFGFFHHPQWVTDNPQVDRLAKLFIFIGVAWWLGGSTRHTLLIWGLALAGYFAALFIRGDGIDEWLRGLDGRRIDFNIRNAQHTAMFFGTGLLGLVAFSKRCLTTSKLRWLVSILWAFATIVCVTGIIVTQTRAIWLALALALPVMGGLLLWFSYKQKAAMSWKAVAVVSAIFIVICLVISSLAYDTVAKRLEKERPVIEMVLDGNFAEVPYTSVGIRIQTWRAAGQWIAERPLVGWGEQGRSLVTDETEWLPESVKNKYGHLHNYFLELWVAYGLLGVAVIAVLAFWVGRATWLAWRGGVLPGDMALFGASFFVYWIIINQFESYNSFWTGVYVHNLILGGIVTHYWHWQLTGGGPRLTSETHHETHHETQR